MAHLTPNGGGGGGCVGRWRMEGLCAFTRHTYVQEKDWTGLHLHVRPADLANKLDMVDNGRVGDWAKSEEGRRIITWSAAPAARRAGGYRSAKYHVAVYFLFMTHRYHLPTSLRRALVLCC